MGARHAFQRETHCQPGAAVAELLRRLVNEPKPFASMSLCLQFTRVGPPAEVLELIERPLPPLTGHEVRVAMRYSPINPADLNVIEGNYGRAPHLPAIPGHEGCGEVEAVGPAVTSLEKGDLVIPLLGAGCWAQHMTAAEHHFARIPREIDPVQASMLRINPVTAWLLLKEFVDLEPGSWVLQNAGNSGVGRALIQIAHHMGLKTVSFVRRAEVIPELTALGADAVFVDDDAGLSAAREFLGRLPLKLAANAVGGDSAIRLMDLLSPGALMVTYGAMSRKSLKVPNKFLIFKDLHLRGLWVTRWLEHASSAELYKVLNPLARLMADERLVIAVDAIVPMRDFAGAVARAGEPARAGKVILRLA